MEKIILAGYGGHAKSVADSIRSSGRFLICGYTDVCDRHIDEIPYLGADAKLSDLFQSGIRHLAFGVGFMGESDIRDRIYQLAREIGFSFPAVIDPSAVIASDAQIGEGVFVGKQAVINAQAKIGKACIINTGSIIEHECKVGAFTHVAVGATICGNVEIGHHCLVGAHSTVIQGIRLGNRVVVGAGAVVLNHVADNSRVVGVPARQLNR